MHQLINPDTSTLPFLFVNELRLLVLRFLGSSQVMGGGGGLYTGYQIVCYHFWTVDPSLSNLSRWLVLQFISQLVLRSVLVRQGRTLSWESKAQKRLLLAIFSSCAKHVMKTMKLMQKYIPSFVFSSICLLNQNVIIVRDFESAVDRMSI